MNEHLIKELWYCQVCVLKWAAFKKYTLSVPVQAFCARVPAVDSEEVQLLDLTTRPQHTRLTPQGCFLYNPTA